MDNRLNYHTSLSFEDKSSPDHLDGVLRRHQDIPATRVNPRTPTFVPHFGVLAITQSVEKGVGAGVRDEVSTVAPLKPWFPAYHTSLRGTSIALENLKKLNHRLDESNIVSLAYMATNQYIPDEDREKYEKQMKEKGRVEYEMYKKFFDVLRTS
jgi:hypothetical protein